jgi:hypothetical protein
MRILYCNKYNFAFSGTEVYLFELMDLMRSHGHEVALFSMTDPRGEVTKYDRHFVPAIDFKDGKSGSLSAALQAPQALYSRRARQKIRDMIQDFRPDVAHVRNIYHHLSPSILWELKAQGVPVVYHLNGSRRELVRENETGLLFPSGDVAQLERSISFLVERPRIAAEMGAADAHL